MHFKHYIYRVYLFLTLFNSRFFLILEMIPCLKYIDTNGVVWKTTLPNTYDYQTCGKGMTGKVA